MIDDPVIADTLFPPLQLIKLLEYVRVVWNEQKAAAPLWWSARKETDIVAGFSVALSIDKRIVQSGIGFGHFSFESQKFSIMPNGMPRQVARTDIQFLHGSEFGPVVTMEFKRLDNRSTLRGEYFKSGVRRYIVGQYAHNCDFAMMVGMVSGSVTIEKTGMFRYLKRSAARVTFSLQPMTNPSYGDPSTMAPYADFDTQHKRTANCLTEEIKIAHLLLGR